MKQKHIFLTGTCNSTPLLWNEFGDRNLVNAISMVPDIDFYRYNINFSLNRVEF